MYTNILYVDCTVRCGWRDGECRGGRSHVTPSLAPTVHLWYQRPVFSAVAPVQVMLEIQTYTNQEKHQISHNPPILPHTHTVYT